jgi:hypothetical protein
MLLSYRIWERMFGKHPALVRGTLQLDNDACLLFARGTTRSKEIALRLALGANLGRLVRPLLTEALVLSMLGGLGGTVLGTWALQAIVVSLSNVIPPWLRFTVDLRCVGFSALLSPARRASDQSESPTS